MAPWRANAHPGRGEPTWRRLIGSTLVLFLVILAFLVGRVRSGADPALAGSTSRPAQHAPAVNNAGCLLLVAGARAVELVASGTPVGLSNASSWTRVARAG